MGDPEETHALASVATFGCGRSPRQDSSVILCTTNSLNLRRAQKFSDGELHKSFGTRVLRCEDGGDGDASFFGQNVAVGVLNFLCPSGKPAKPDFLSLAIGAELLVLVRSQS